MLRDELARGLAYATLRAERLPPPPRTDHDGDLTLDEALAALPPAADALVDAPGLITGTLLARAASHPTLGEIRARLRLDDDPLRAASALRRAAVRLLTEGEQHPGSLFTILHGVTGMDGVCGLVPLLPRDAATELVRAAGGALLALRVAYLGRLGAKPVTTPRGRLHRPPRAGRPLARRARHQARRRGRRGRAGGPRPAARRRPRALARSHRRVDRSTAPPDRSPRGGWLPHLPRGTTVPSWNSSSPSR